MFQQSTNARRRKMPAGVLSVCLLSLIAVPTALYLSAATATVYQREESDWSGRLSETEARAETKRLFEAAFGPSPSLEMNLERVEALAGRQEYAPRLLVTCRDADAPTFADVWWDGRTGAMSGANLSYLGPLAQGKVLLRADDAEEAGQAWLKKLGFVGAGENWRLSGPPVRKNQVWMLQLTTTRGSAQVRVDAHTGKLIWARVRCIPGPRRVVQR